MATSGLFKSRNLLARKQLQQRKARRVLLETLETRQLLAVGPQLLGVQPNSGELLENGEVLSVSPRELVFRFDDSAGIDPTTLDGIRVIRSGEDGVFDRASAATDFGTGGQTLVEFYAREAGESGNGIEVNFTSVSRNNGRAPVVRVDGRSIEVELNSNPLQPTRVEDLLQAFDASTQTPATSLVYALRLRGSQTISIGDSAPRSLVLSGANAAKAATNFNLGNNLEVRFIARDSGNAGLGITINVTARDRGGAGNPIVSVVGKDVNVELNSNPRFATTVREFVDALNSSSSASSALLEAQLVSGIPATRIGTAPITYTPIELSGVSDIEIEPAYVGLGDTDREVVMRFAEALPDDQYRLEILGQGTRTLRNVDGEAFNGGVSRSIAFELDLGAQIESVVPQPIVRNGGQLTQQRNRLDLYFNNDKLLDVSSITQVNGVSIGSIINSRTPLYFDSSDTLTFVNGTTGSASVLDPSFYQLFHTADTLDNGDDVAFTPNLVRYYPDANRVVLSFERNLGDLVDPGTGQRLDQAELRLRVGTNEPSPLPPLSVDATAMDPADTFDNATQLNWIPGGAGSQSILIDSLIQNTSPFLLDFPGGSDEPGNRQNRYQDNLRLGADAVDGTSVLFYNFQGDLGVFSSSPLLNAITEQQKVRVREIFSIYESYLGVRFVETENLGMTIAVGDTRAIVPFEDIAGSGDPGVIELNGPGGTYYEAGLLVGNGQLGTVLDIQDFSDSTLSEYAGPFQRAAMQAVGRLLGLGLADEAGALTIQSFDAVFAPGVGTEIVLPGDADIVHGQFLYRPDSKDIDLYQFSIPNGVQGRMTIETFAERMSSASLLDSQIQLFRQDSDGGWESIASNDDYYSSDSFLDLELGQGNYIVGVSASGNNTYDPTIPDSGIGGRSEGDYQLRMNFRPPAQAELRDGTGVAIDGDNDGAPGGIFNFWFAARPENRGLVVGATGTAGLAGETVTITSNNNVTRRFEFTTSGSVTPGSIPVSYMLGATSDAIASSLAAAIQAQPDLSASVSGSRISLQGDRTVQLSSGLGDIDILGRTLVVDKLSGSATGTGSLASPFKNIDDALSTAQAGDIVRIVGNGGSDGQLATAGDNLAYEIGFDNLGRALPDGATFDVPQGVAVLIDAGAILKMRRSRIGVGSTSSNVDRSAGSLMVLGTPNLVDADGNVILDAGNAPAPGSVFITSVNDSSLGVNANPNVVGVTPIAGDWGGLDFRARVDNGFADRTNQEKLGQFMNWVSHADVRYGGGQVVVDGLSQTVAPIQMVDARPTVAFSSITSSSSAAMTATPNSFLETNFHSPAEQGAASFTVDYDRVGPDLNGNRVTDNSINGLQIRLRTPAGTQLERLTTQGRFDDTDIVHYIPENLAIQGTPGGATLMNEGPSSTLVNLTEQAGGTLSFGTYNYRFTRVDANGVESVASEPTESISTFGSGAVVLSNLPVGINRIYRSTTVQAGPFGNAEGAGPYELIAEFSSNTTTYVDTGGSLGDILSDDLAQYEARLDARLAIDGGTVVKSLGARIDAHLGGQLIAEGQPGLPVIFTSLNDSTYGAGGTFDTANSELEQSATAGDWGGIYIGNTSTGSIDQAVISYGGGTTRIEGGFADFNAIEVHQGDLRLANTRLTNNSDGATTSTDDDRGGRGTNAPGVIFIRGAQPIIVDNILLNNAGPAITANVSALNSEQLLDYGRSTGLSDRYVEAVTNRGPLIQANRLTDNEINGLVVRGGELTTEGWWDDTDIVHVVLDEILVPEHQHFSGLRLASSPDQSLVVKLEGEVAGITATGNPLDNADRIGGSVQLIGQPGFPVILTSLSDNSVGAGFGLDGSVQNDTIDAEGRGLLPTIGEVNNGTLIDNDVPQNIPGYFGFDVGPGGNSGFFQGQGGITAQGNTQLFVDLDVIFEFLNFVDVGGNGNAINLGNSTVTLQPTLVAPDLVVSEGNFQGGNGVVNWRVESTMPNGETTVFNKLFLSSADGATLGDLQVINYLDEDIQGVSDDILYLTGTPGESDFRAFTLDGPERIGFSQGGVYLPTPGELENAVYEGWAADQYRDLLTTIETAGTTYTVDGNIDLTDLPLTSDAELGDIYGPNDITTAFAWRVDPGSTEAVITSFLELVPRNPATNATAGDWRSVLLDTNSNDRNVAIVPETESPLSSSPLSNETPTQAQFIGAIAPNEKAGDENLRLGFQVEGVISRPGDVDVYSFNADPGTEVWLDIDRTNNALDVVVELVDANGRTLALSDNSLAEEADPSLLYAADDMPIQSVNPLRQSAEEFYYTSAQGTPKDLFSTNPKDAGMRVRLPGNGDNNLYHIRVRSSNLDAGDSPDQLLDPSRVGDGLTKGAYQLQVRLSEDDEVPGSSVTYADIRFGTNGLELVGVPGNSPLLGENSEVEVDSNGVQNDDFANAQLLGNLLTTNRQAISVAGELDDFTDVDWFAFDIQYEQITPTALREYFATVIDMDYADGIGRPDTSLYVFDASGNLILGGLGSGIVDDQASPVAGAGNSDLSRGSAGTLDPYIGSYELPAGRYFLAVTNSDMVPAVMATYTDPDFADPNMRLQPIEGMQLIAEEYFDFAFCPQDTDGVGCFRGDILPPTTAELFPQESVLEHTLTDIALYVSQDVGQELTNVYIVNPFTGEVRNTVGRGGFDVQDIDFRPNGELRGYDRTIETQVGGNVDRDTLSDYIDIDPGTAQFTVAGNLGLDTNHLEFDNQGGVTAAASDDGFNVEAITFTVIGGQERGFVVANRPTPPGEQPAYYTSTRFINNNGQPGLDRPGPSYFSNVLYEIDENSGAAVSAPAQDKQDQAVALGAGSTVRDRGYIETFTLDGLGNIVTRSSQLLAREVTQSSPNSQPVFVINDGDVFTVIDGGGFQTRFEFDLGPQVLINYNPAAGFGIRDGMQFSLDGNVLEFDTGNTIVIDAINGQFLADGSTVRIRNAGGTERIFEFDNDGQLGSISNVRVPFANSTSQTGLVQALMTAINGEAGFGVAAESVAGSNRISLVNASTTDPVVVTGLGLSIDGTLGVSVGATRIPISEAATRTEFVAAISQNVGSGITVAEEGGRMNFSGAINANFADLEAAGIFSDLGTNGNVGGGNLPVRVLATDTAETVAARIAAAINDSGIPNLSATANGEEVQLVGVEIFDAGPLAQLGVAPGGIVTGIALVDGIMYAVSDEGGLYRVFNPTSLGGGNVGDYIETSYDLVGINFTGLVEGPVHAQNGELRRLLFGIDNSGTIHAFDTAGRLQPVFANGATSIETGLFNANGLTMSSLDFNLWHETGQRSGDAGHGRPATPNDTRVGLNGGTSMYFGFESPGANGVGDLSGANSTGLSDSYNFPGGAAGAIESAPFSLAGISAGDLPTMYFSYFFETEEAASDLPLGTNADDYMRDALRIYASGEDGQWILLTTNNDPVHSGQNGGTADDEFDTFLTGNPDVQPLFDNRTNWRQARVPLDLFAGQDNVRLRVEFSSHGGFGYGLQGGRGPEIRTISGDRLVDGETLVVNGQTFEIETGPALTLPGGPAITNGDSLVVEGVRYVFTDGSLPVTAPDVPVTFAAGMNAEEITLQLQTAISGSVPALPTLPGLNFFNEVNDVISKAEFTGVTGDTVEVVGSGLIGDNPNAADAGEDVDMIRVDADRGAQITATIRAASIGSGLDSFLRVFDAEGRAVLDAFGQPIQNDNFNGTDSQVTFTVPEAGTYYIGVSGAGNQGYNAAVEGTATIGSLGAYELAIQVRRQLVPVVSGNRLQLQGAKSVELPAGSPVILQGGLGTTGQPIYVEIDMSAAEVATAVQEGLAAYFAGGVADAYKTRGDIVDLTGLVNYSGFDFITGLPEPTLNDLDAGPFGATTTFVGDALGGFNLSTNFDGTTNRFNPGALGAQNNDFEGVYLDDFIIGLAGRGEMVLQATSGDTSFINDPQLDISNPSQFNPEILVGPYQFEIRGGETYGVPTLAGFPDTFSIRSTTPISGRAVSGVSIQFNPSAAMVAGSTFTVSDGTRVLTFEMDDVNDGLPVQTGNIAVPYSTAVVNPANGALRAESATVIAARVRDIINSSAVQAELAVSANLLNNDRTGATSDTVVLFGTASAEVPSEVGQVIVTETTGGANRERRQGQIVINSTTISNSQSFGITIDSAARDAQTNAAVPGSPRNTVTLNTDLLAPGAVVMNSEFLFNNAGGIAINGDPNTAGLPTAAVPFVRLVNNTIVGGTISTTADLIPTVEGGQLFEIGNLAFADSVVNYSSTIGGGPSPVAGLQDPTAALAPPDFSGSGEPLPGEGVVSLGRGGQIELQFTNNFLTGSGDASPDLMVFEVGDSEEVLVEVSSDGVNYTLVGRASAASPQLDIDAFGFNTNSRIGFVRLTDVVNQGSQDGDSVGADIDAVGAISSVPADRATPSGTGIVVANNATATLLNNIVVNSNVGIDVDTTSESTIIGGTVYQRNVVNVSNTSLGQFPLVLDDNIPLFVDPANGNLYPAQAAPTIDTAIDSLEDRPSLVAVKRPLGISESPILAPEYDIKGQLRVDDPSDRNSGSGDNVFKDRGAQDRADFVGPSVVLRNPVDNDNGGRDTNPDPTIVELTNATLHFFDIQIIDGLEPSDPSRGTGVNHSTVNSNSVLVYRNNRPLVEGIDYRFGYDSTNGVIRLQPLAGIWQAESAYTIRFVNSGESGVNAQASDDYTDGDQFRILDASNSQTIFEFDLGFTATIPSADGTLADLNDGDTFILDDQVLRVTFEFDRDGSVSAGNTAVSLGQSPTIESAARAIQSAIESSGMAATVLTTTSGVQILGDRLLQMEADSSGLTVTGQPGVQTVFGLQIPLRQGVPSGLADGQAFTIDRSGAPVAFEFDNDGTVLPGNIPVFFGNGDDAQVVGQALVDAINGSTLGLNASYDGEGLVRLGGDANTRLDLSATALTQAGIPGEPAAVPISLPTGTDATDVASLIKDAIDAQGLTGAEVTQFGSRLVVDGVNGISGVGANLVNAIRDLAGNPLKPNQVDGSTTLSIFLGEGYDYGDASAPYASEAAAGGPRHSVVDGLSLGVTNSVDADAKLPDADDDDGVNFTSTLFAAFSADVDINVTNTTGSTAYVSMWIDFNADGFFATSEQVIASQSFASGTSSLTFAVPQDAVPGSTFARVRLSTDAAAVDSPVGDAVDGEVEDWQVTIESNPYQNPNTPNDSNARYDVSGDGFVSPIDALILRNYLNDPSNPADLTLPAPMAPPYLDVNGDGSVSPIDVLEVISFLNNRNTGSGEGEAGDLFTGGLVPALSASQDIVLASDWTGALETIADQGLATRRAPVDPRDAALLGASDEDSSLADFVQQGASLDDASFDQAWADLSSQDAEEEDLFGPLLDELL